MVVMPIRGFDSLGVVCGLQGWEGGRVGPEL